MFVLSHSSVAAQFEAFFSVDGGLGNSKNSEIGSSEDVVAALVVSINQKNERFNL